MNDNHIKTAILNAAASVSNAIQSGTDIVKALRELADSIEKQEEILDPNKHYGPFLKNYEGNIDRFWQNLLDDEELGQQVDKSGNKIVGAFMHVLECGPAKYQGFYLSTYTPDLGPSSQTMRWKIVDHYDATYCQDGSIMAQILVPEDLDLPDRK